MINIAIFGYGVVGAGVAEVIRTNSQSIAKKSGEEIFVKKIVDIRDITDSPDINILTKDAEEVFQDDSISIIAETIGGIGAAYEITKRALSSGRHVVTSNKELVATYGPELLTLAKENGVHYLFEASVGGGIPIIRPLYSCLAANEIDGITGILNGTTNYILTKMCKEGSDFSAALREAQDNGYAEADPTADIEGHDACRKIAILSSIAYNQFVDYKNIVTEGITKISAADMMYAEELGAVIKLVAVSKYIGDKIYARVSPCMVNKEYILSNVNDVFNAIVVSGNAIGEAMFYGPGAGKLPTASAVVADVIDIVKHIDSNSRISWKVNGENNTYDPMMAETSFFIRIIPADKNTAKESIEKIFAGSKFVELADPGLSEEIAFVVPKQAEGLTFEGIEKLKEQGVVLETLNVIRML
jgi:homoserine dehydrogenase